MNKKRPFIVLAVLVCIPFLYSEAQVNVWKVNNPAEFQGREGVFYSLPASFLRVEVLFDMVEEMKGPYADYAYKFLGLDKVITADRKFYELKDIHFTSGTFPDPEHLYFVEFLQKQSKDPLALHLVMTEEGYITAAALGIEMAGQQDAGRILVERQGFDLRQQTAQEDFRYFATDNQVLKIDTIIKMVSIDTSTFRDVTYKQTMVYRTMEERASEAADFIETIRDDRFKLLSGYQEVNYSKETIEFMDQKLLEMEDAYLSLFKGMRRRESYSVSFNYVPVPEKTGQSEILFHFSVDEGMKKITNQQGEPVYVRIDPVGIPAETVTSASGQLPATGLGFVFRTPLICQVTTTLNDMENVSQAVPIHQLGMLNFYPVTSRFFVELHPANGAFRQIKVQ